MKTFIRSVFLLVVASSGALLASPATDKEILEAAESSYNFRSVLENRVKVEVHDARVTLTGTVHDEDEKALAAATVENLPGVVGVKNEIVVAPTHPARSDGWIAFKVRSRLLVKANVSGTGTKVSVKDGVVTLSGVAATQAEKDLAEAYARDIEGVRSVKNEMTVGPKSGLGERLGEKMDDTSITTQVKFALLRHKSTSMLKTHVETTDGVVVITGEARSEAEKSMVTKLAEETRGVRTVNNNMTVKP